MVGARRRRGGGGARERRVGVERRSHPASRPPPRTSTPSSSSDAPPQANVPCAGTFKPRGLRLRRRRRDLELPRLGRPPVRWPHHQQAPHRWPHQGVPAVNPARFVGVGMDPDGHASTKVELIIDADRLVLRAGFDVVIRRTDVDAVRVRWPRPWQAMPFAPLLAVQTSDRPTRWRALFWGPAFTSPGPLRAALGERGWPV